MTRPNPAPTRAPAAKPAPVNPAQSIADARAKLDADTGHGGGVEARWPKGEPVLLACDALYPHPDTGYVQLRCRPIDTSGGSVAPGNPEGRPAPGMLKAKLLALGVAVEAPLDAQTPARGGRPIVAWVRYDGSDQIRKGPFAGQQGHIFSVEAVNVEVDPF